MSASSALLDNTKTKKVKPPVRPAQPVHTGLEKEENISASVNLVSQGHIKTRKESGSVRYVLWEPTNPKQGNEHVAPVSPALQVNTNQVVDKKPASLVLQGRTIASEGKPLVRPVPSVHITISPAKHIVVHANAVHSNQKQAKPPAISAPKGNTRTASNKLSVRSAPKGHSTTKRDKKASSPARSVPKASFNIKPVGHLVSPAQKAHSRIKKVKKHVVSVHQEPTRKKQASPFVLLALQVHTENK
tara:strand:- start:15335 stop:16069 length:735 start_codon:yes stop_codon:yes gene_type:complete